MRKVLNILALIALCTLYVVIVRHLPDGAAGVSVAFLGFIGKAVSAAVGVAGKVIGVGGGSNKPITISTQTDPNLTKLIESQNALIQQQAANKNTILGMPRWVVISAGVVVVVVGGYLLLRRRH